MSYDPNIVLLISGASFVIGLVVWRAVARAAARRRLRDAEHRGVRRPWTDRR